jgi:hypothetical protein
MQNQMSNDNNDANGVYPSDQAGQGSQDAIRHQKAALHHKFHNGSQSSGADQRNDQQSQASAHSVDLQSEGQPPEIPKVGSRDAPRG